MAFVYGVIAIDSTYNSIPVTENILLGLSLSAFFSSLSDLVQKISIKRNAENEYYFLTSISLEFIENSTNPPNPAVSVSNVKANIKNMNPSHREALHPSIFAKKKCNIILHFIANSLFIVSISVFILTPYFLAPVDRTISVLITLLAFSVMCLNLYLDEIITEIGEKKNAFQKSEQFAIAIAYPSFSQFLNFRLEYNEDYVAIKQQEDNADANT